MDKYVDKFIEQIKEKCDLLKDAEGFDEIIILNDIDNICKDFVKMQKDVTRTICPAECEDAEEFLKGKMALDVPKLMAEFANYYYHL